MLQSILTNVRASHVRMEEGVMMTTTDSHVLVKMATQETTAKVNKTLYSLLL